MSKRTECIILSRNYQVKRFKKSVDGQSVHKQSEVKDDKPRPHIKIYMDRHASIQSEYVDEDLLRIEVGITIFKTIWRVETNFESYSQKTRTAQPPRINAPLSVVFQRFRHRNKRGHSSDSKVQRLLYGESYGSGDRNQSDISVISEVFPGEALNSLSFSSSQPSSHSPLTTNIKSTF